MKLSIDTSKCNEPILMDQEMTSFTIYFCVLSRNHDGPCQDKKKRLFQRAYRIDLK